MKYYMYVSESKIDMLYPQISDKLKKKVTTELRGGLRFFGGGRKVETESEMNLFSKLDSVIEHIKETEDVGTPSEFKNWIQGTLLMSLQVFPENGFFYLTTTSSSHCEGVIGLGGSMKHLIGKSELDKKPEMLTSSLPDLAFALKKVVLTPNSRLVENNSDTREELLRHGYLADRDLSGQESFNLTQQKVEFLSKRYASGLYRGYGDEKSVFVGSPLYIELADI